MSSLVAAALFLSMAPGSSEAASGFTLLNMTASDRKAEFSFRCPRTSQTLTQMEVAYQDEEGVDVVKTYHRSARSFKIRQEDDDACFIDLKLVGLRPITRYDVCFDLATSSGGGGDFGTICQEVKTTMIVAEEDEAVNINLEGVALIAFIGLGLMFALMLCVFYEKVIAAGIAGCTKTAARSTKAIKNRMTKDNDGRPSSKDRERVATEERDVSGSSARMPRPPNGYGPASRDPRGAGVGGLGGKGSSNDSGNGSGEYFHDSNRTLNEHIIREALENRPGLLKDMDAAAAKMREGGIIVGEEKQIQTYEEHLRNAQEQRRGLGGDDGEGRDNYGYESHGDHGSRGGGAGPLDPMLLQQQRRQQQHPYSQQHQVQQVRPSQPLQPQYSSSDYRRVYRDDADFFLHERETLKNRNNETRRF